MEWKNKISQWLEEVLYPVLGLPSYQKYVIAYKRKHPEGKPKTREEFYRDVFDARYSKDGPKRCC